MMTTTTISSSSSYLPFRPPSSSLFYLKKGGVICNRQFHLLKLSCTSKTPETETETETTSSLSNNNNINIISNSAYELYYASLGGLGFIETTYLTYLKLTGTEALCPASSSSSCNTILTSSYASVFGLPLPLFGMVAYGLVTFLGLKKAEGQNEVLIWTTTSMAAASAYLLYILGTEFAGETCLYCYASAALSFSLFFITLKNYGFEKWLGSQLVVAALVVVALTASYNNVAQQPVLETDLPYVETKITKESSPLAISVAKQLQSIGAKLYGAFWCSHCLEQKEMFGREAAELLNYVECFPNGVKQGTRMVDACYAIELKGFPTWEINGEVLSGEKNLSELAILSGLKLEDSVE